MLPQTDNILLPGVGEKFISFANADGKRWIMPRRGMRLAMGLYQPSSLKGRLVKSCLPLLSRFAIVRKALRISSMRCSLTPGLRELICGIFGVGDIDFAIFCGTPSAHRKITMQVSSRGHILGYCKFTDNDAVYALFEHEAGILNDLRARGLENIPQCLFCGALPTGEGVFVQTTGKTGRSKTLHKWGALHEGFLSELHDKTQTSCRFDITDFSVMLSRLESLMRRDNIDGNDVIIRAIKLVRGKYHPEDAVAFSSYHADFTPWNMFVENGELFVFDFEYACRSYPPGLDRYHFFTQTAVLERHRQTEEIFAEFKRAGIPSFGYICYLLDTTERYISRSSLPLDCQTREQLSRWVSLLSLLLTDYPTDDE